MRDQDAARAAVAQEMAKLRNAYLDRLPNELKELGSLADRLTGGEQDRPCMEELHQRLHKLAGSGGTFGLSTLGERARDLEKQLQGWLENPVSSIDTELRRSFAATLATLSETLGEAGPTVISPLPTEGTRREAGRTIHIWLVEDDALLGEELLRQLEPFGFEVTLFTRVADAETATRTAKPDILIMDVWFPEEIGNATEALAVRPSLRDLDCPLIFVSSQGDFQSRVRAARLGAEGYFLKPLDIPGLVERIERIFEIRQAPPQRIMIVDDDASLAEHFRLVLLGAGMDVEVLSRPEDLIDRVSAFHPELVLMDMHMPHYSGPELAGVIRQHDNWVGLPIVYLSAETDFSKQLQALGQGADDFLTKPISDAQLVAAVRVRVDRARQLADQISKDSLTGLLKHASIKESAQLELLRTKRMKKPVSLAMIDIDHFKSVNDQYGHAAGDLVIKSTATLLRQRFRKSDIIGRYGGEEFVVVMPECDQDSARMILDDVRRRFAALRFSHAGQSFNCTLSAGIACSAQRPDSTAAELLVAADQALYAAKRGGRNQVCVDESSRQSR